MSKRGETKTATAIFDEKGTLEDEIKYYFFLHRMYPSDLSIKNYTQLVQQKFRQGSFFAIMYEIIELERIMSKKLERGASKKISAIKAEKQPKQPKIKAIDTDVEILKLLEEKKEKIKAVEYKFAVDYINDPGKKTQYERCLFFRIRQKLTKKEKNNYLVTYCDGQQIEVLDVATLTKMFNRTKAGIQTAIKEKRPLKLPRSPVITRL